MAEAILLEGSNEKKRKRPRAARACELCRAKKYRCDEMLPCSQCKKQKVDCVYDVADHVRQRVLEFKHEGGAMTSTALSTEHRGLREPSKEPMSTSSGNALSCSPAPSQWSRSNARQSSLTQDRNREGLSLSNDQTNDEHDVEVSDVNPHTQNVEFHGKTSSIAFLAALQPQSPENASKMSPGDWSIRPPQPSLVSVFHNEAFSPEALANTQQEATILKFERYYFRQAQTFLDGYFQNIHFIHPILDRQAFMTRCEDLWFGKADQQPKSFVALYYSIMSLGALIKTWDDDKLDGLGRLEWSRKFFNLTRTAVGGLASMTAVESVQCLFFMAKICQNELNPSLAYLYLGWATRASCSAGFNRKQPAASTSDLKQDQIAKLWWGLYSLEIEISFALGRPDSLGPDAYHNQTMPALDDTETALITVMVPFARIIREVSLSIYLSDASVQDKTARATQIEADMNSWLYDVPSTIRPSISETSTAQRITKAPTWAKRQRLVLELRFYNVKMVLFRPFLTVVAKRKGSISAEVKATMDKCVDAARSTIELMHEMYCHHAFFRTWWYNTTYIVYAASIVLCYGTQVAQMAERSDCLQLGRKAVEILDAMEESIVARNASEMIQEILSTANDVRDTGPLEESNERPINDNLGTEDNGMTQYAHFADDSLMSFLNIDENLDFLAMTFPLNSSHFPFWNDAGDHL